jgi:hypothetical protein
MNAMLRSIFAKTMREQRWALSIWSALIVLMLVAVYAGLSQVDLNQLGDLTQNRAYLFLNDAVATNTASGYVTFKYGFFFSLVLSIFALLVGSRLLRGEEARGSRSRSARCSARGASTSHFRWAGGCWRASI